MAWVEEKLHASDLIRQLSGVDDAETKSGVHDSPAVSIDLVLCSAVEPTDASRLTPLCCALLGLVLRCGASWRRPIGGSANCQHCNEQPAKPSQPVILGQSRPCALHD